MRIDDRAQTTQLQTIAILNDPNENAGYRVMGDGESMIRMKGFVQNVDGLGKGSMSRNTEFCNGVWDERRNGEVGMNELMRDIGGHRVDVGFLSGPRPFRTITSTPETNRNNPVLARPDRSTSTSLAVHDSNDR